MNKLLKANSSFFELKKFGNVFETTKDFKDDETKSVEWGRKKLNQLNASLNFEETDSIFEYTLSMSDLINNFLIKHQGSFVSRPDHISETEWKNKNYEIINKKIQGLDSVFKKVKPHQKSILVYRRSELRHIYAKENVDKMNDIQVVNSDGKINTDIVKKIKADLLNKVEIINPTFMSASLSRDPEGLTEFINRPFLWKIKLPKQNSNYFYVRDFSNKPTENEVLIDREHQVKYKDIRISKINGRETIVIEMECSKKPS